VIVNLQAAFMCLNEIISSEQSAWNILRKFALATKSFAFSRVEVAIRVRKKSQKKKFEVD